MTKKSVHPPKSSKIIFSCSGSSDTGEIADRAARRLRLWDVGKMSCLSGIAGLTESVLATAQAATRILMIDGCDCDCGKKTLERAGLDQFVHLRVTDLGMVKGRSPLTPENIEKVVYAGKARLSET
jgi:uncharacterized metal-binding protein